VAKVSRGIKAKTYRFISRNHELGIKYLCQTLQVSRSGYYAWLKRVPSARKREDQVLSKSIHEIFILHRKVYGSPRIHLALRSQGILVGKKRVERLMQEHSLKARAYQVTSRPTGLRKFMSSGENLKRKEAVPTTIDQQWVADVTYLKAGGQWYYLATIMDAYSRKIVGWSLKTNRTFDLTSAALNNALKSRSPVKGLLFHTDRGIEFRNLNFQEALKKNGMRASVNRPGRCTDNAHMESFFHTLKTELIRGRRFKSGLDLRLALNSYINQFYNHKRMHSGIGYLPPAVFEQSRRMQNRVRFIGGRSPA